MVIIDYFSDVLCVWAYSGQVRLDELQKEFADDILVRHRFMPLFADTRTRVDKAWEDKGGYAGFGAHVQELCAQWPHTRLHPGVWTDCRPSSCTSAHVFLRAVSLCLGLEETGADPQREARAVFDRLVSATRKAFFEQALDVSRLSVLLELLPATGPTAASVKAKIDCCLASCSSPCSAA